MAGNDMTPILQLLQANPQLLGSIMMGAQSDPQGVAAMADGAGMPVPGTPEWTGLMNPMSGLGSELSGGPNPTMAATPPGAPAMIDPRNTVQTADILGAMGAGGSPGGANPMAALGGLDASGNPMGAGTQAAGQTQRPLGKITPPNAPDKKFSGGIAGAQKAPDTSAPIKPGVSPAQALMQAMMQKGGGQTGLQVPTLGSFLS